MVGARFQNKPIGVGLNLGQGFGHRKDVEYFDLGDASFRAFRKVVVTLVFYISSGR